MNMFSAGDVLQFAIRLEENGESFYRKAAAAADDKETADLFSHLADEEVKHKKIFEDLFSQAKWIQPAESYPGEYLAYLGNYIDGKIVFSGDSKSGLSGIHGTAAALDFAIQRELDSILYYHELRVLSHPKIPALSTQSLPRNGSTFSGSRRQKRSIRSGRNTDANGIATGSTSNSNLHSK